MKAGRRRDCRDIETKVIFPAPCLGRDWGVGVEELYEIGATVGVEEMLRPELFISDLLFVYADQVWLPVIAGASGTRMLAVMLLRAWLQKAILGGHYVMNGIDLTQHSSWALDSRLQARGFRL
jgi:hypothetical protein